MLISPIKTITIKPNIKYQFKDDFLQAINLVNDKYTLKEIEVHIRTNFYSKGFVDLPNVNKAFKKIRLSLFMNQIIHKFIIKNEVPNSKYYSIDHNMNFLEKDKICELLSNIF